MQPLDLVAAVAVRAATAIRTYEYVVLIGMPALFARSVVYLHS